MRASDGAVHVALMRDRTERVCSYSWEMEATLPNKDKAIQLAMNTGEIRPLDESGAARDVVGGRIDFVINFSQLIWEPIDDQEA